MHNNQNTWNTNNQINNNMWGIKQSIYGRQFNALRSAQQKYSRRCMYEKLVQVSLEMHASGYGRAAYDYLSTICVEDKFPNGANLLWNHMNVLKRWKKLSGPAQSKEITQMCYNISHTKSDRHPAYLARLALTFANKNMEEYIKKRKLMEGDSLDELEFAGLIEEVILRLPKKNELPTQEDFIAYKGMDTLHDMLFSKLPATRTNSLLFDYFKKNWAKQAKGTARLYIYNLVGRIFHKHSENSSFPSLQPPELKEVELDDYVYDKHTVEGKKRKRGLKHFLEVGAKIENPSKGIEKRASLKRKAEQVYLETETAFGTRHANSRSERKRIREQFNALTHIDCCAVISTVQCQKPCGGKPRTMYVTVKGGGIFFVKGPYKDTSSIEFQRDIDIQKEQYGILPMGIEISREKGLYYLSCEKKEGFENMSPAKLYNDTILWNLTKVLIFRAAFNISDTNLRNVMVNHSTKEVLSVDEMTPNRMAPRGQRLVDYLFNKPPRKMFCDQIMCVIRKRREDFIKEVKKYGEQAKHLLI